MFSVWFTIAVPMEESKVETITEGLKKIDENTLISRDECSGRLHFKCPEADEPELGAFGKLFNTWLDEANPRIIGYNSILGK